MRNPFPFHALMLFAAGTFCLVCSMWRTSRAESPAAGEPVKIQTLPVSRGGQDLVGTKFPSLHFDRWLNTPENRPLDIAHSVTLYRWWTDTCPFCAATLPAIEQLRAKYAGKGLKIVAVYHPKPPRAVKDTAVLAAAMRIGYQGPIAIDADWSQLRKLYLSTGDRGATSVSFLVDRAGVIRFVHPGVEYFPSDKPGDEEHNADFQLIDKAIAALLEEK